MGFSQQEAAKYIGVSERQIRRYETEEQHSLATYVMLAEKYDCSELWLLLGIGPIENDAKLNAILNMWSGLSKSLQEMIWDLVVKGRSQ